MVILALIAWLPSNAGASAALSLSGFSPASGPVGTVVTLTGTGFTANDTFALFNGVPVSPTRVAANGTSMKVAVPPFATSGPVTVQSLATGQSAGLPGTAFQVTAGLQLSSNRLYPGGDFVLSASGLTPDQRDTIEIGSNRVGTALVNSTGGFQLGVTVPWNAPSGRVPVQVFDPNVSGGVIAASLFALGDWEQANHDAAGTGSDPYETSLSTSTVSGLVKKWSSQYASTSGLTVADGKVFAGDSPAVDSGGLILGLPGILAENIKDGSTVWGFTINNSYIDEVLSAPTISNGVVYMDTKFGVLAALDEKTGKQLWGGWIGMNPGQTTVANGTLYVVDNGKLLAYDATNGSPLWVVGSNLSSAAAVSATGTVIVGGSDGNLYAFNGSSGAPLWTKPGGGGSMPAIVGNVVYMGSADGNVYARHVGNGSPVWTFPTGGPVYSPTISGGVVFAPSDGGTLFAIQASTGTQKWSQQIGPTSSTSAANGVLYVNESDGKVHALNAATGNDLWSAQPTSNGAGQRPIVSNGRLFEACSVNTNLPGGCLIAYGL